jgi:putative methionine-R-sulfoxide reductase with GAF domain
MQTLHDYCQRSQLSLPAALESQVQAHVTDLLGLMASSTAQAVDWYYFVPQLGEGGACSIFDALDPEPFDLATRLGGINAANLAMLQKLTVVAQWYQARSASQWFGIYKKMPSGEGFSLVKMAYYGAPSRAEFPLTPEFAAISNNSSVGLSGTARIINDVPAYLNQGGEYYTCDPKVLAEACVPLFAEPRLADAAFVSDGLATQHGSNDAHIVGIVDAEAFTRDLYQADELALLAAVVLVVPAIFAGNV